MKCAFPGPTATLFLLHQCRVGIAQTGEFCQQLPSNSAITDKYHAAMNCRFIDTIFQRFIDNARTWHSRVKEVEKIC